MMPVRSVGDFVGREAAVDDRLIHRDVVPGGAAAVEPHRPAVDHLFGAEGRRALDLGAKAEFGEFLGPRDAGFAGVKAGHHFLGVVADRGDDAHAGDDDAPHPVLSTVAPRDSD